MTKQRGRLVDFDGMLDFDVRGSDSTDQVADQMAELGFVRSTMPRVTGL